MPENAGRGLRFVYTLLNSYAWQPLMGDGTGGNTERGVGDVLGGGGSQRRRFCGETASARQAFTALRIMRTAAQMLQRMTDPEISGW
jgi:hypothetical protein